MAHIQDQVIIGAVKPVPLRESNYLRPGTIAAFFSIMLLVFSNHAVSSIADGAFGIQLGKPLKDSAVIIIKQEKWDHTKSTKRASKQYYVQPLSTEGFYRFQVLIDKSGKVIKLRALAEPQDCQHEMALRRKALSERLGLKPDYIGGRIVFREKSAKLSIDCMESGRLELIYEFIVRLTSTPIVRNNALISKPKALSQNKLLKEKIAAIQENTLRLPGIYSNQELENYWKTPSQKYSKLYKGVAEVYKFQYTGKSIGGVNLIKGVVMSHSPSELAIINSMKFKTMTAGKLLSEEHGLGANYCVYSTHNRKKIALGCVIDKYLVVVEHLVDSNEALSSAVSLVRKIIRENATEQ